MLATLRKIAFSAVLLLAIGGIANPLGSLFPSAHAQEAGGEIAGIAAQIQEAVDALGPDATSEEKAAAAQQAAVTLASNGADVVAVSQALAAVVNVPVESAAQVVVSGLPPEQQESAEAALTEAGIDSSSDTASDSGNAVEEDVAEEEGADEDTAEAESADDGSPADNVDSGADDAGEAGAPSPEAPAPPPEAPAPPPAGGNPTDSDEGIDPDDLPTLPPEQSPT